MLFVLYFLKHKSGIILYTCLYFIVNNNKIKQNTKLILSFYTFSVFKTRFVLFLW